MYCQVFIDQLMSREGEIVADFPVRDFLRMFGNITAKDCETQQECVLTTSTDNEALLEIAYDTDNQESLAQVKLLLNELGIPFYRVELRTASETVRMLAESAVKGDPTPSELLKRIERLYGRKDLAAKVLNVILPAAV
jgi:hypothetical protein